MPRYYFNLTDRANTVPDAEGLELPGDAAALEEARLFARDLAERKLMDERDWNGWAVAVADEGGRHVEFGAYCEARFGVTARGRPARH